MQFASEVENFPYLSKELCYYEIRDNDIFCLDRNEIQIKEAYLRAKNGESKLYATWHGQYRTDMFYLDDLKQLGQTFGYEESDHVHEFEWKVTRTEGAFAWIDIEFKCGCTFDGAGGIQKLSRELLRQMGWNMVVSGRGGYDGRYTIKVWKNSLA